MHGGSRSYSNLDSSSHQFVIGVSNRGVLTGTDTTNQKIKYEPTTCPTQKYFLIFWLVQCLSRQFGGICLSCDLGGRIPGPLLGSLSVAPVDLLSYRVRSCASCRSGVAGLHAPGPVMSNCMYITQQQVRSTISRDSDMSVPFYRTPHLPASLFCFVVIWFLNVSPGILATPDLE